MLGITITVFGSYSNTIYYHDDDFSVLHCSFHFSFAYSTICVQTALALPALNLKNTLIFSVYASVKAPYVYAAVMIFWSLTLEIVSVSVSASYHK